MKVAVIGAGVCGLISVKICKEYGLDVVAFEKTDDIGGLWRYKASVVEGIPSVMKTTVINTSKEMMAFSDFPPSKEYPVFMRHEKVLTYFQSYAEYFNLTDHIRFGSEVQSVKMAANYDKTGQWDVTILNVKTKEITTEVFDAVLLANGHHAETYWAKFKNMEKFKGRITHSHSYKDHKGYEDKRILVIGIGNSGGDISVELGRLASQVYLSTRSGNWCLSRVAGFGLPFDMVISKRFLDWFLQRFTGPVNTIGEWFANLRFNHDVYGMACNHRIFNQHPMVNDDLVDCIATGTVVVKPNVKEFTETGVLFEDGTVADDLDDVLMCTGYSIRFPMLEDNLIKVADNRLTLYKMMYPPQLKHHTFAVIGLIQPWGAIMPIAEMQVRVFCESLTKQIKLPNPEAMLKSAEDYNRKMFTRYGTSRRHTIQVDYLSYMDDLSSFIGAKPNPFDYLFTDPVLAYHMAFSAAVPYQYRLRGPHKWPGAREAIVTTWDRTMHQIKQGRPDAVKAKYAQRSNIVNFEKILMFSDFSIIIYLFFILVIISFMAIIF